MHLSSECGYVISKWIKLREYFKDYINLIELTPQAARSGNMDTKDEKLLLQNLILLFIQKNYL